jgi:hypothetical protein
VSPTLRLGSFNVGLVNATVVARIGAQLLPPPGSPPIGLANLGNNALSFVQIDASGVGAGVSAFARGLQFQPIGQLDAKFPIAVGFKNWSVNALSAAVDQMLIVGTACKTSACPS